MLMPRSLLVLFLSLAVPAHAGVYKCANEKGGVIYQDAAVRLGTGVPGTTESVAGSMSRLRSSFPGAHAAS